MNPTAVPCPDWLAVHLQQAGGAITFRQFMTLALNDPDHGYYGAGHARIGPDGDFVTSPSLGTDFTALLATQLIQWLKAFPQEMRLSIVEIGPGDGHLAADLIQAFTEHAAALLPGLNLCWLSQLLACEQASSNGWLVKIGFLCVGVAWMSYAASRSAASLLPMNFLMRCLWRGCNCIRVFCTSKWWPLMRTIDCIGRFGPCRPR